MAVSAVQNRFLNACARKPVDATPVWFMRQAGRYMAQYRRVREKHTILEICETPELAAEVTLQPVRALGVDAAILFADILLPLRPMGVKLEFVKGEGPALSPRIDGARQIDALRAFDPREGLWYVLDALRIVRAQLPAKTALIGFAGAPFTVASYLVEGGPSDNYLRTKALMHAAPALWARLMDKLAAVTGDYLVAQVEAGAQAVQLFDSWVGALSPADYRRYVAPYSSRVLKAAAKAGVPVIHFGTGTAGFLEDFAAAGGDVVGVDWRQPLDGAWKRIGLSRAVQGNLDPVALGYSWKELKPLVRDVLRAAGGRRGHIFNLGHGILPHTPPDNVRAVAELVHEETSR